MHFKINKGLDIRIAGEATDFSLVLPLSTLFAIQPSDFRWLVPKLKIDPDNHVDIGTPLFCDKQNERIVFVSPIEGTIKEVVRGEKRVIKSVTIERDNESPTEKIIDFEAPTSSAEIRSLMLQYGLWPCLRQRPYSTIPEPDIRPKSVFIPCFDSNPLAPDFNILLRGQEEYFLKGLQYLREAAEDAPLHLCMKEGSNNQLFEKTSDAEKHYFSGPHPAGNVATHIHNIDPLDKGETVWYVDPQDVARIGRFFGKHTLDFKKRAALTGPALNKTGYFDTIYGADLSTFFNDNIQKEESRIISGSVLSGNKIEEFNTLRFYDRQITVIPEGGKREIFGWLLPGLKKWSLSHTFLSWLTPKRTYDVNTSLQGGRRAFMMTDVYDKVFPFDLIPLELMKACEIKDIEKMEALGIYEVDSEDFALCELVCPSKKECQKIVEEGMRQLIVDS
ncbi:MAG: Na(+)-translocating NADH-quinone reductase subunit A [Bacteroidales bacterium]|nr:Na(+)-translocating NADH-quinone reductase subunit A [Bacteroidales bacterium]